MTDQYAGLVHRVTINIDAPSPLNTIVPAGWAHAAIASGQFPNCNFEPIDHPKLTSTWTEDFDLISRTIEGVPFGFRMPTWVRHEVNLLLYIKVTRDLAATGWWHLPDADWLTTVEGWSNPWLDPAYQKPKPVCDFTYPQDCDGIRRGYTTADVIPPHSILIGADT